MYSRKGEVRIYGGNGRKSEWERALYKSTRSPIEDEGR